MNAKLTYNENTPKTSSSCSNVGRPVKGFEKRRNRIAESEPTTFAEFLRGSLEDIEQRGGEVTLGTLIDGIWQEYIPGESWNIVRAEFPSQDAKFRKIESFQEQYEEYQENFYNNQKRIQFGF
jgi:predicted ArsR family transcriptional regulator